VARETTDDPGRRPHREDGGEAIDGGRVQPREGLVQDQEPRVVRQRHRQLGPLLVAVREGFDPVPAALGEAETLRVGGGKPVEAGDGADLVAQPHLPVQAALLGHVPEVQPVVGPTGWTSHRTVPPVGGGSHPPTAWWWSCRRRCAPPAR